MYIERFHNQNRSFSRGSTPSANSNNSKNPKVHRLNNSLNKINLKLGKEDKVLKNLQESLIGQYDNFDFPEHQQLQQKYVIGNVQNGNLRQLFISQNARENTNQNQKEAKPPLDNAKLSREKQKLEQIYKSLHSKNGRKTEQKISAKKQDVKQITPVQETINSNLFKEKISSLPLRSDMQGQLNGQNEKNYCFYDASYYQNYIRNSPPELGGEESSSKSSSFYSQMGGERKTEINVEQIQTENLNNIRTITSQNNIQKQESASLNPSFYNNKSKFVAMLHNKNQNQSFQSYTEKQQQRRLQPHSLQYTQERTPEKQQYVSLAKTSEITQKSDQKEQNINIKNESILKMELNQQNNMDPLSQIDELKQIMMIEQQNISNILNKGNKILQPKSANNSHKETKTSFYQKQDITISDINKEGLLGAYEEYNKLSKHDIIEKLLVSEHIMKQLYKKTKHMQEQMQQIQTQQQHAQSDKK